MEMNNNDIALLYLLKVKGGNREKIFNQLGIDDEEFEEELEACAQALDKLTKKENNLDKLIKKAKEAANKANRKRAEEEEEKKKADEDAAPPQLIQPAQTPAPAAAPTINPTVAQQNVIPICACADKYELNDVAICMRNMFEGNVLPRNDADATNEADGCLVGLLLDYLEPEYLHVTQTWNEFFEAYEDNSNPLVTRNRARIRPKGKEEGHTIYQNLLNRGIIPEENNGDSYMGNFDTGNTEPELPQDPAQDPAQDPVPNVVSPPRRPQLFGEGYDKAYNLATTRSMTNAAGYIMGTFGLDQRGKPSLGGVPASFHESWDDDSDDDYST